MSEKGHNTNLAAEYYVLSMLYRVGANAYLTLGNKKSIDIVIDKNGKTLTADVKRLKDTSCFPIDNWNKKDKNHYLIFVSFLKRIHDPTCLPEIYVVPSLEIEQKHKKLEGKSVIYKNPQGKPHCSRIESITKTGKEIQRQMGLFYLRNNLTNNPILYFYC